MNLNDFFHLKIGERVKYGDRCGRVHFKDVNKEKTYFSRIQIDFDNYWSFEDRREYVSYKNVELVL